jgi:pilus assembly protein CpaE
VFADANRSSKATAAIRQIAERVMGVSTEDTIATAGEKKSLLGNFDFKAMLAKKPKVDLTKAD